MENILKTITIAEIANGLEKTPVETVLPNGKVVNAINWLPSDLPNVYNYVASIVSSEKLGCANVVTIDGAAPIWMYVCVAHALHPVSVQVNYPQGGCVLPVSGFTPASPYTCDGVTITTEVSDELSGVDFTLDSPAIDVVKALLTLNPPAVLPGVPVVLSGRAPAALYCAVASAIAHTVPYIAVYQPGVGTVVSVSHSSVALGTVL